MIRRRSLGTFYSGLSGLVLPMPKYKFPEEFQNTSRLTYYASLFNSIEINRSFYVLPQAKTVAKWAGEVPSDFRFTFKLWKQITHAKGLRFDPEDVSQFMRAIDNIGNKKGCLLIQFPASIKSENTPQLQHLLEVVRANNIEHAWKVAIEFRDRTWYNNDVFELVDAYHATIVLHDKARVASPQLNLKAATQYIRFHGPQGNYRGTYDDSFISEYASYIQDWREQGKSVFVYFNNTMGNAFNNLEKLNKDVLAFRR